MQTLIKYGYVLCFEGNGWHGWQGEHCASGWKDAVWEHIKSKVSLRKLPLNLPVISIAFDSFFPARSPCHLKYRQTQLLHPLHTWGIRGVGTSRLVVVTCLLSGAPSVLLWPLTSFSLSSFGSFTLRFELLWILVCNIMPFLNVEIVVCEDDPFNHSAGTGIYFYYATAYMCLYYLLRIFLL